MQTSKTVNRNVLISNESIIGTKYSRTKVTKSCSTWSECRNEKSKHLCRMVRKREKFQSEKLFNLDFKDFINVFYRVHSDGSQA